MRKVNVTKCKNIENSSFETILYKPKNRGMLLIEHPDSGKVFEIPSNNISEYIYEIKSKTDWIPIWDGDQIKVEDDTVYQYKFVTKYTQKFHLNLILLSHNRFEISSESIERIFKFENDEDFKLTSRYSSNSEFLNGYQFYIEAFLPVLPLGVLVTTDNSVSPLSIISKIFCKYNEQHYQFPYGNVRSSLNPCLAEKHYNIQTSEQFFYRFITSSFNQDLGIHLKYNCNAREVTFNKNHIENELEKEDIGERDLNLIDLIYYLSKLSINEFLEKDLDKFFLKTLKDPKEDTNEI